MRELTTRSGEKTPKSSFELNVIDAKDDINNNTIDNLFKKIDKCVSVLNWYKNKIENKVNTIANEISLKKQPSQQDKSAKNTAMVSKIAKKYASKQSKSSDRFNTMN